MSRAVWLLMGATEHGIGVRMAGDYLDDWSRPSEAAGWLIGRRRVVRWPGPSDR
jgi:hypothetical protein